MESNTPEEFQSNEAASSGRVRRALSDLTNTVSDSSNGDSQSSDSETSMDLSVHIAKRSQVWLFFKEDKMRTVSICQVAGCGAEIPGSFSTNLKGHLRRHHKKEYGIFEQKSKHPDITKPPVIKYGLQSSEQLQSNRALSHWIGTTSTIPVNVVEQKGFKHFMDVVNPLCVMRKLCVPSRAPVIRNIGQIYSEMREAIAQKIEGARRIAVSADIWSKRGLSSSYLGVLATFYDPVKKAKTVLLLGVKEFESVRHTSNDISREMSKVLEQYRIPASKIWFCATDSASNMVCAFRDSSGFEHQLDEESGGTFEETDMDDGDGEALEYSRYSCFIHSLLLCLKPFDSDNNFRTAIRPVKELVAKVTNSTILTGALKTRTGLQLIKFSAARCNIAYLVMHRLLKVKAELNKILQDCGESQFSESQWQQMNEIHDFLEPFNKYTDMSSTDITTYFSEATVMIRVLIEHVEKYLHEENFSDVATKILEHLRCRFMTYEVHQTEATVKITRKPLELYLAATLIDPRFCQHLDYEEEKIATKRILRIGGNEVETSLTALSGHQGKKRKYDLQPKTLRIRINIEQARCPLEQEIKTYLNAKYGLQFGEMNSQSNPLEFWDKHSKEYPRLAPIALDLLSLPLNTAPLERSFSSGGIATLGPQNGLEGENLSQQMTLTRNEKYLEELLIPVLE